LENSIGDPTSMDCKGNTPLHLALKAIMKIDERNEYLAGKLFSKSKVNKETSTFKYFSLQENDTCTS
jgi:hypothetical protein